MIFKDYYKILELETNKVSIDQIKNAYRIAAKKYHPDVNIGNKLAEEKIKDINEAYRVLSVASSKRKYDKVWNSNVSKKIRRENYQKKSTGTITGDYMNMLFGDIKVNAKISDGNNNSKHVIRGENIETEIEVPLREAFYGKTKTISLKNEDGKVKTFSFDIPEGIKNGAKIRIIGQGKDGKNGGKNGDLYIKIKIKDEENLKIRGNNVYTNLYLTPWEAALGTKTYIESIEGKIQVYVPQCTQTGEILTIEERGYKNKEGTRGQLIAEVKIMVPKKLTQEEINQFKILNNISKFNPRISIEKEDK